MFDIESIKQMQFDAPHRAELVTNFVQLSVDDEDQAMSLMQMYADRIKHIVRMHERGNAQAEDTFLQDRLMRFTASINGAIIARDEAMIISLMYQVLIEGKLGSFYRQSHLGRVMRDLCAYKDEDVCRDWMIDQFDLEKCPDCNTWEYSDKMASTWGDESVCRICIDNNYRYSDYEDCYIHTEAIREALDEDGNNCLVHEDNDNFHWDDDADTYVHEDYEPPEPESIGSYHSSKNYQRPIQDAWSLSKQRWFGIELEVEMNRKSNVSPSDKARELHQVLNQGEFGKRVFFERDGSLTNGFEMVSQPMSMPMHQDFWKWLQDPALAKSMLSHNTSTCGLHIHVSRDAMTKLQIAKMVSFINDPDNENLVRAVARRYAEGYCKIKDKKIGTAHYSEDRYEAVNLTSRKTIEFRIFKGSLKYESVIAALEFVNALVEFTARSTLGGLANLKADDFMEFIDKKLPSETQTLRAYLTARFEIA